MRTLFLFLPALVMAMELPHAPGMYPPEEIDSASATVPPSPYGSEPEPPYLFYYEKDSSPSGSNSEGHSLGQRGPGREGISSDKSGSPGAGGRGSGPVPPLGHGETAPESYYEGESTHGRPGSSSSSHHGGVDQNNPYGFEETTSQAHGKATHRPSAGPKEEENGDGVDPIDPYEHGKDKKYLGKKGTVKGGSTMTLTEPSEHWHTFTHMHFEDPPSPDHIPVTGPPPLDGGSTNNGAGGDTTHNPSSISNGDQSLEKSVFPTDTHETKDGEDSGEQSREAGGKGYRADKDFEVNSNFKGDESLSLTSSGENLGKSVPNDLLEVDKEIDKLQKLPVRREQEEIFKSTTGSTPDTFQPCCACCKEEIKVRQPVIGGGYIEATSSQVIPGPLARPSSPPLNPGVIAGETAGYPTGPSYSGQSAGYSQNPLQSYFSPAQSPAYLGSYGSSAGCGCAPQICCRPVQPCCLPTLPCCPPPPPIPCCPQISICCQPIVLPQPCCISLPRICLPTIPLCFRGCPSCPCRRRRSLDDPRHHSRVKRQSCMRRRVKRQSSCRQCNGLNNISQPSGGCGTCNGSHRRVKRLGCLPCGRKKREVEQENEHIRQKRSCLPCLGGRKKRQASAGSCTKCSLLQTFITRHKRSISCGPCGRKKRSPSSCSCSSSSSNATTARMKRAVISNFDDKDQCDRSCCDYSKCGELRARKLDLKI